MIPFFLLLSALLCLPCTAAAKDIEFRENSFPFQSGPYVGASVGYRNVLLHNNCKWNYDLRAGGININFSNEADAAAQSAFGAASLGYTAIINQKGYLGAEININFHSLKKPGSLAASTLVSGTEVSELGLSSEIDNSLVDFLFLAKPGFLLTSTTALYGVIGASASRFKMCQTITLRQFAGGDFLFIGSANTSHAAYDVAFAIGMGIECRFHEKLAAAIDLVHTRHNCVPFPERTTAPITSNTGIRSGYITAESNFKATTTGVFLKLLYYW